MSSGFDSLISIFGNRTRALEVFFTIKETKPATRLLVHESEILRIKLFCEKNRLFFAHSSFKVVAEADSAKGGYSNRGIKVPLADRRSGELIAYISRSSENARLSLGCETENDHAGLGEALGYPACCIRFFIKNFEQEKAKALDFVEPAILASGEPPFMPRINTLARCFDFSLISHMPCSFKCKASADMANINIEAAEGKITGLKSWMQMLSRPYIYSSAHGIFALEKEEEAHPKKAGAIAYRSVQGSCSNRMHEILKAGNKIAAEGIRHLRIFKGEELVHETRKEGGIYLLDFR